MVQTIFVCLLIVLSRVIPGWPLVVAANRDELLARPAVAMTRLEQGPPRIVGGRDELAGGTWLAVNDRGVFASLTNLPAAREPGRRSRGELPLLVTRHASAIEAARALESELLIEDFSRCWLLAGDRDDVLYADLTGTGGPRFEALAPGLHVLENKPIGALSEKASAVRAASEPLVAMQGEALIAGLFDVLRSHDRPDGSPAQQAPCVHAGIYGTRSSTVLVVSDDDARLPDVRYTDGPPCTSERLNAAAFWG